MDDIGSGGDGDVLGDADRRLALRCYQMGWIDSEFRFLKQEREQPQ